MATQRRDQVLVNKNFLLTLFAVLIVLVIVCAVLLGVVVSNSRSQPVQDDQVPIADQQQIPAETTTDPQPVSLAGSYRVNTTADALNMRAQPLSDAEIVATIPKGTIITVTVVNGEWGYTTYGDASGWINMGYLMPAAGQSAAAGLEG